MLKIWSNGIYECTLHRMINNSPTYHVSIAFFYEPNFDACIDPVNFCKEKVNGVATVEKAVYGEHLVKKVLTNFGMLITVLVLQEAIKGVVSEFEIPKGEDQSQPLYQFQWLCTNGLLAVIFSYGLVFTALKSRGARSWRYGTGHDNKQPKGSNRGVQKILPIEIPSMLLADLNRMTNNFGLKALIGEVTEF